MMYLSKRKFSIYFDLLVVALIIINSRTMIMRFIGDDLLIVSLFILIVLYSMRRRKYYMPQKQFLHYFVFLLLFALFGLFNGANLYSQIGAIIVFVSVLIYSLSTSREDFIENYLKLMSYLAFFSLLSWFFVNIFGFSRLPVVKIYDVDVVFAGTNFFDPKELLYGRFKLFGHSFVRNNSIFWEGGAYAVFLNLALLFLFIREGTNLSKRSILFSLSILTTFSTAGYIVLFMIYLFFSVRSREKSYSVIIPQIFIFILLISSSRELSNRVLVSKVRDYITLSTGRLQSDYVTEPTSSIRRYYDAVTDVTLMMRYPIFGYGYANYERWKQALYDVGYAGGGSSSSNGLTNFIAASGIPLAIFFFILILKNRIIKNKFKFIAIFAAMLISQGVIFSPILLATWLLIDKEKLGTSGHIKRRLPGHHENDRVEYGNTLRIYEK